MRSLHEAVKQAVKDRLPEDVSRLELDSLCRVNGDWQVTHNTVLFASSLLVYAQLAYLHQLLLPIVSFAFDAFACSLFLYTKACMCCH
jgi:hypothetical protein